MSRSLHTAHALSRARLIDPAEEEKIARVAERYALRLTPEIAGLIDSKNESDPIARQFIPDPRELDAAPEELTDPIGDHAHSPCEGIVHRYPDRVLLKIVSTCPVYCRFCFRREMVGPGKTKPLAPQALATAIAYIAADPRIWEVILTGGDPFVLSVRRLREITESLAAIPHIRILRWHSRVPVVDPTRITPAFIRALKNKGATTYVALHTNHPRELTGEARAACARIVDAGIPMVSQTVLLKGVNDDAETLEALMRALVELRIKPYYLHHGDRAPGTAHLRTSIAEGRALMGELHARASGLCQPNYVLDIPGGAGKVPVGPCYLTSRAHGGYDVADGRGGKHLYTEQYQGKSEDEPSGT